MKPNPLYPLPDSVKVLAKTAARIRFLTSIEGVDTWWDPGDAHLPYLVVHHKDYDWLDPGRVNRDLVIPGHHPVHVFINNHHLMSR